MTTPNTTTNAPAAPTTASIAAELRALDGGGAADAGGESTQAADGAADADDAGAGTASPTAQGEAEAGKPEEGTDDAAAGDEVQAKEDKPDDDASKQSRRAKQRARLEEAERQVKEKHGQLTEAVGYANRFRREAEHFKGLHQALLAKMKADFGYEPDATSQELAAAKLQLSEHEAAKAHGTFREEQDRRNEVTTLEAQYRNEVTAEVHRVVKLYPAYTPESLAEAYVMALSIAEKRGEAEPTMESVAKRMLPVVNAPAIKAKHEAARAQHAVNKTAPAPIRGGKGSTARQALAPTTANIAALLRAETD